MKRLFCTCAFAASVAMLLFLAPDRSLTAETNDSASAGEPIKVLNINLKTSNSRPAIEGLELQIQNTAAKPIQYLVVHAILPGAKDAIRIPLRFGNAPLTTSRSTKVELLQPGAKVDLQAGTQLCDRVTKEIASLGRVPSVKEIHVKINWVVFEDRTGWAGGESLYPDPTDPNRWNTASELARSMGILPEVTYSNASYKPRSDCYRFTGITPKYCCDDPNGPLSVADFHFTGDPNGHVQPNLVEACCGSLGSGCCTYNELIGCS